MHHLSTFAVYLTVVTSLAGDLLVIGRKHNIRYVNVTLSWTMIPVVGCWTK